MRLKSEVDEATKRYYLHLIVVHVKSNQTEHVERRRRDGRISSIGNIVCLCVRATEHTFEQTKIEKRA